MAKKPRPPANPKRVDRLQHKDSRRTNIPTQENSSFMHDEDVAPVPLEFPRRFSPATHPELYKRNQDLDPQLVWRGNNQGDADVQLVWKGKDEEDAGRLRVDAVPIYIQEKIHPKAIIDDIRRRQPGADDWKYETDTPDLFGDFNGIPDPVDKTSYYEHDRTGLKWSNRMILGDSLSVMASLAEKEGLRGKVQMIYLDPPYGIKFNSNWQVSTRDRKVEDGKGNSVSREAEVVRAFRDTWTLGLHSYLSHLRDRLILANELLAETGSAFVQIGDENVHAVRMVLDEVFGSGNFVGQIVFKKTTGQTTSLLAGAVDYLLLYAKDASKVKYRQLYRTKELGGAGTGEYQYVQDIWGIGTRLTREQETNPVSLPAGSRIYAADNLTSQKPPGSFKVLYEGVERGPGAGYWKTGESQFPRLIKAGRVIPTKSSLKYKRFLDDFAVMALANYWDDTSSGASASDPKLYVVQTTSRVLERCILMTTDPGDLVLDPTCGSGTTAHAAEMLGRRWITTDTSRVALTLARTRLMNARFPHYLLKDSPEGAAKEAELTGRPAGEVSGKRSISMGFVYKRVPHVMLKSIANNAEIDVIWEKHQPGLDVLRASLNAAIGQSWEDHEVPRAPVFLWNERCQKLHARILELKTERAELEEDEETPDEILVKHDKKFHKPLKELNTLLGRNYNLDSIPDHSGDPLPAAALAIHSEWWAARCARQTEMDASIARNADTELLYDQPYEDKGTVRVAGPFSVESLSPHRVLSASEDDTSFREVASDDSLASARSTVAAQETGRRESDDFVRVVLDNLETAGVGNTKKGERLRFIRGTMRPFSGRYVNAQARYKELDTEDAPERKAAIFIGPEYGTVTRQMIVAAVKEAIDVFDVLIICGFGFEAHATGDTISMGGFPILRVNMNQDLRMADRLKASDQGNLFVVFGEPDVDLRKLADGRFEVEIKGVDIFNPNTGELQPSGPDEIACWFLDHDYDEQSFFVRHAYFLGGNKPYEKLQKALKAEINEEAWATLHSAISFPFKEPASGKIAVKVINHYGDEVLKVFDVREAREDQQ
jgi:adenine-specific DNA-methyltransferase